MSSISMPKKATDMTQDEVSLLLFLETCAVDHAGRLNPKQMNSEDFSNAYVWDKLGFIEFGRVCSADLNKSEKTYYARLSDKAHRFAATLRKMRADRLWKEREYQTAKEYTGS